MKNKELLGEDYQTPGMKTIEIKARRVLCGSFTENVSDPFYMGESDQEQVL